MPGKAIRYNNGGEQFVTAEKNANAKTENSTTKCTS